jgi:pilus assembly protein FimV
MRKLVSILLLSVVSLGAQALGLGNIELTSGLNQPFNARIELISPTPSEMTSLSVRLADPDAFRRAGIERSFLLTTLRIEIEESATGADYIRITTREPVREPFLNFLLEASWANGRIFREYTVLLDPPLYDPNAGRPSATQAPAIIPQLPAAPVSSAPVGSASPGLATFSGTQYGPVSQIDTLWSIANQTRPDGSITVQQMMLALLRANPEAFIGNNVNGLRQGQVLRIPDRDQITQSSSDQAFAEVRSQNAMWEQMRGSFAAAVTERPVSTASQPVTTASPVVVQNEAELRLVAPGDQSSTGSGQTTGVLSGGSASGSGNDALLEEQLNTLTSENVDLQDRLAESEALIDDLRRLIELKDDELAVLQQQIAGGEVQFDGQDTDQSLLADEQGDQLVEDAAAVSDEDQVAEPEPAVIAPPVQEEQATPAPIVPPAPVPVQAGLVDQIIGFIVGNIAIVGGALAVLLLAGFAVARKKKAAAEADELVAVSDFPNFDGSTDETEMPGSDGPEINIDVDSDATSGDAEALADMADDEQPAIRPAEKPAPETAPAFESEEDPLAEVNVFLAYEHFDQAEEFVRDAIKKAPTNLDFHSKLLEVFYSSGDKAKYEEEARVLHGLVGGSGPHWDMALIMWQEISPNRALFEHTDGDEDDAREDITSGRGIVDLTADDSAADDDGGIDFDLGMDMDTPAAKESAAKADDVLDITSGSSDMLDITAADSGSIGEDLLDVTAAVGLDTAAYSASSNTTDDDNLLDFEPSSVDEDVLDITAAGGEDLLDVTAHTDFESEDEDLLDITAATGAVTEPSAAEVAAAPLQQDDNALDFDLSGMDFESATDDGEIEMSSTNSIKLDSGTDEMLEFSLDTGSEEDSDFELDLGSGDETASSDDGLLQLDTGSDDDDSGLELDFSGNELADETLEFKLDMDSDDDNDDGGIELDFSIDDNDDAEAKEKSVLDMESTVKLGRNTLSLVDEEEDEDGDHTVFVPRTADAADQSRYDEIATKLDLAKAYVELGDGESAKSILEEVISDGNDSQRQQAQELMSQIN